MVDGEILFSRILNIKALFIMQVKEREVALLDCM